MKTSRWVRTITIFLWLFIISWFAIGTYFVNANPLNQDLFNKAYLPIVSNQMQGYFVSVNGSDLNPGTFAQPFRTIGKAARKVVPGDTVYVRAGVYNEAISLNISGTSQNQISFLAYPGETPIIEGGNTLPTSWTGLLTIKGDWIRISGFEVRNSKYAGVQLSGRHDYADHIFAHHNQRNGIYVQGDYGTVEDCQIWQNAMINENNKAGDGSSALTTSRDTVDKITDFAILRNNMVWENWAIGIDSYESNGTVIEGNTVHDNLIGNVYISDATNILLKQNMIYMTVGSITYGKSSNFGILLGDELYTPPSDNITLINNIAYGNNMNLKWHSGDNGYGVMKNVLIANNTLVNAMPNNQGNCNIDLSDGPKENVRILNNIIIQNDGQQIEDIKMSTGGVVLANNLWSKSPRSSALGTGSIIGDAKLANPGLPYIAASYKLISGSPAINKALPLAEVTVDFFLIARGVSPDIGAAEFVAGQ